MTIAYMRVPAEFLNSDYVDDKIVIIVGRRVSMKPTFVLLVIIHILEAVGIIWYSVSTSIYDSKYIAKVIQVPENMVLTTANDISYSVDREKEITVPAGTEITPDWIFSDSVYITYDGYGHISANWDDFVEQDKLEELENIASQERINNQKKYVLRGSVIGVCVSVCWLIIGTVISYLLTKKESLNVLVFILIAVHLIVGLLFFLIFGTGNYLSK